MESFTFKYIYVYTLKFVSNEKICFYANKLFKTRISIVADRNKYPHRIYSTFRQLIIN